MERTIIPTWNGWVSASPPGWQKGPSKSSNRINEMNISACDSETTAPSQQNIAPEGLAFSFFQHLSIYLGRQRSACWASTGSAPTQPCSADSPGSRPCKKEKKKRRRKIRKGKEIRSRRHGSQVHLALAGYTRSSDKAKNSIDSI